MFLASSGALARSSNPKPDKGVIMFEGLFQPMHMLIVFGIALLVFGPKKLPELGKGLGESIRGFKSAMAAKEESAPVDVPAKPEKLS
jgi:sec-independent protein translocase protein TatA